MEGKYEIIPFSWKQTDFFSFQCILLSGIGETGFLQKKSHFLSHPRKKCFACKWFSLFTLSQTAFSILFVTLGQKTRENLNLHEVLQYGKVFVLNSVVTFDPKFSGKQNITLFVVALSFCFTSLYLSHFYIILYNISPRERINTKISQMSMLNVFNKFGTK